MPKSENQKLKTLYVAKFLMENTDENHAVGASDIIDYLESECDIIAERRSIYRDIATLRDNFGMDIEGGQGGRYKLVSRQFEIYDLKLLAECVHAAKFISQAKAIELVETICQFCSEYQAEELLHEVFLCDRVKTTRKGILNTISTIRMAMATRQDGKSHTPQKISFKYMKFSINDVHSMVERHHGKLYVVSPFQLLINEGNYYLLAFDDDSKEIRTYRVDRMKNVSLVDEPRAGVDSFAKIDMATYVTRVFSMYDGEQKRVMMRFDKDLLDTAIERFGTEHSTTYSADGNEHFIVTADVDISPQFFGWLCGLGSKVTITHPKDVAELYQNHLKDVLKLYKT